MRLLQLDLCSSFPLARAGAHRNVHSLLLHLARDPETSCLAVFARRGLGSQLPEYDPKTSDFEALGIRSMHVEPDRWIFDCGYPAWAVDSVEAVFEEAVNEIRPDMVWSNCFLSLPLLRAARRQELPCIWYIHDCRPDPADLREAAQLGVHFVAVSKFIRDRVREQSGGDCQVIYQVISEEDYLVQPDGAGYVTFLNPRPVKGYEIFLEFAPLLPEVQFLVVEVWPLADGLEEVERQLQALGNVRFWRQRADVREIYKQTRLLLVPSVVEDAAPRVIRETQLSGIPVLGSPRGGIPEMIGDGGLVIEDFQNPQPWAEAIAQLMANRDQYERLSAAAWRNARRNELMTAEVVRRFKAACQSAIRPQAGGNL